MWHVEEKRTMYINLIKEEDRKIKNPYEVRGRPLEFTAFKKTSGFLYISIM